MALLAGTERRIEQAKLLIEHSRDAEAVTILESVVQAAPDDPSIRLLIAQALTGAGRADDALPHLEEAARHSSAAADANGMLGYWHQARGGFAQSKVCFEASITANPRQSLAYYGWSQSNRFTASDIALLKDVETLSADETLVPDDRMILYYVLGKGYADLGEYEKSLLAFDKANRSAFEINLSAKPFDRKRYAEIFDQTIATFSADFLKKHRGVGLNRRLPIFIVGMMRSGTTLVEQILSSHPDVAAAGEVEFWLDEGPSTMDLSKRSIDSKKLGALALTYENQLRSISGGKPFVTDKMPQNFQRLGLIHLAFPNAPIIHIRRSPLDTCISIYTTAYQQSPAFAHERESIVFAYKQYLRLMAHWRKVLPPQRFLEVDYEALVSDPEPVIRKIVSFCGLSWDNACLTPEANDRLVTTPSLWQVRQPLSRSAIGRWKVYEPWLGAFRELTNS